MKNLFNRWRYSHFKFLIPKNRQKFDQWSSSILKAFGLEDSLVNRQLIASMTFRLDFKYCAIVPKYYFDSIHRLQVNEMIHSVAKEMEEAKKNLPKDEAKISLLKQSPEPEPEEQLPPSA